ncbi:MAG: GNAT family N-acetyltransferase [Phycisphaerales bacterium]|nr:GNAT family N-acetyltransferase [Phycisphaerales bacterium]
MSHRIRRARLSDVQACLDISNADAAVSHPNFTIEPETLEDWQAAFSADGGRWHVRCGYRDTALVSVYLDEAARGLGLGRRLYAALLPAIEAAGFHSIIAGIALPNPPSVALHEAMGFTHVGTFHEVGFKFDRRWDVSYWELLSGDPSSGSG